jgi:hypothetical protein
MSDRKSPFVKKALFAKTNVDAVKAKATGGVYLDEAGLKANHPVLIIEKVTVVPSGTFGQPAGWQEFYFNLKAWAVGTSEKTGQEIGEEIIDAALDAIAGTLNLDQGTCRQVKWFSDLPTVKQQVGNKTAYMTGIMIKISVDS